MHRSKRKTKIIATLGPATSQAAMIERLMEAGVDLFRLNFSHGAHDEMAGIITTIRSLSGRQDRQVSILADLQGPKIRTGKIAGGSIILEKGQPLEITTEDISGHKGLISTNYKALPDDVSPGARLLLDDGSIELRVISTSGTTVSCKVIEGGVLTDHKGINLPGVAISAPSLTEKDHADLEFCLDKRVDYIALSFVRRASDIENLQRIIHGHGLDIPVVAKIEKPDALRNFLKILAVSDAVMVARGDLGVELSPERVPLIQKKIISLCNRAGKPVITATQMLESMITHHTPTRAETSDVANAILDGTDAVMLSGETAVGEYPLEAVSTMVKVALEVEKPGLWRIPAETGIHSKNIAEAVAEAACLAASTLKAKAIVVITQSGRTAALISKLRPQLPIIAITPFVETRRRLALYWGVTTGSVPSLDGTDQQIAAVEEALLQRGFRNGDLVVITMGAPLAARCATNLLKVHRLGENK